jgi:hypothetical protein
MHGDHDSPKHIVTYGSNPRKIAVRDEPSWCELCADPGAQLVLEGREDETFCIQCVGPEKFAVWVVVQLRDMLLQGGHAVAYLVDAKSGQVASRLDPNTWSDMDRARQYAARHGGKIAWVHESGEVRLFDGCPVGGL